MEKTKRLEHLKNRLEQNETETNIIIIQWKKTNREYRYNKIDGVKQNKT